MHFASIVALAILGAASSVEAGCHRRHHNKIASQIQASGSSSSWSSATSTSAAASEKTGDVYQYAAQANLGGSSAGSVQWSSKSTSAAASASTGSSSASSSSSSSSLGWGLKGLKKNGIYFGWLPDDGVFPLSFSPFARLLACHARAQVSRLISLIAIDAGSGGGTAHTIYQIESAVGAKTSAQGWYAQAQSGTLFDGSQFKWRKDQILSGGVFQPAVMPTGGWWGLTASDNRQVRLESPRSGLLLRRTSEVPVADALPFARPSPSARS